MINIHKKLLLFSLCAVILILCGCGRAPQISKSVSAENFNKYEKIIRVISDKYNLNMKEEKDPNYNDRECVSKDYTLSGDDIFIKVYLSNDALLNEEKGEETFFISYTIPENDNFDLGLFTELVNSVSGNAVSRKYCEEFLSDALLSRNIAFDSEDELIHKSKALDWYSNWAITYILRDDGYSDNLFQDLKFTGLTKATEKASPKLTGEALARCN